MTEFHADRYRRLLSDLRTSIGERMRGERELAALTAAGHGPAALELERSLTALTEGVQQELAAVDAQHVAERTALEGRHRAESAASEAEHRRITREVEERFAADLAEAEHSYEENCWMLSSVLDDDSENSPKRQYESLRKQLEDVRDRLSERWNDLKSLYDRSVALVEQRRQSTHAAADPPSPPRNRKEAIEGFDDAAEAVRLHAGRLRGLVVPRLFDGWTIVLLTLGVWGTLFAAAYFFVDPAALGLRATRPEVQVLMAAGAGLAGCVLILLIVWGIAARQTGLEFEPLHRGMIAAQTHHQHWLRFAKEEFQRREEEYRTRHAAIVERRDRSLRQFAADRDQRIAALHAIRSEGLRQPSERRQELLREGAERFNRDLLASEAAHKRATTLLLTRLEQERSRLTQEQDRRTAEHADRCRRSYEETATRWKQSLSRVQESVAAANGASREAFREWTAILDEDWSPPETIPAGVRIGEYRLDLSRLPGGRSEDARLRPEDATFKLPAVLPFPESPSLLLEAPQAGRSEAVAILQVAMLRLLTLIPPGRMRFTIVDPVGLGENFGAFMHLADVDDLLISGRVWTEPAHIEEQLSKLTEHMENVFQKYLRNQFATIEEYNAYAGEVAEPYRILVVANFPAGFSDRAARRLESIVASGPRCGVYTLLSVDPRQAPPSGFDAASLEPGTTVLRWKDGRFVATDLGADSLPLLSDAPPPPAVFADIVRRIGDLSRDVRRVEVPFGRIAPPADRIWTGDSRKAIDAPLGRSGATRLQHLRLGPGTSQHVLVAGKTGSGKSTLLHVLITNLALRYSPEEVEFFLVDFKKGVEFKTYATHELPHARVIAVESDREFGVSVLERLDAVLKERGDLFRHEGVQDLHGFREARPGVRMPRLLLIVDEFQEFFTEDDKYAQTASLLLDRLVRQGRAFGIHVLLGSQTLGGAYSLARTTIGQMAVRIALQCSESDAHLILSEDNTAARLLTRPGEAIYNDANGLLEGNSPFQISWLGDDERDGHLDHLRELARQRGLRPPPAVVFEGNVPADPARNEELAELIDTAQDRAKEAAPAELPAWLGDAVSITGPARAAFRRRSGANLLLVGQDAEAAAGILATCLISLGAAIADRSESDAAGPSFRLLTDGDADRAELWRRVVEAAAPSTRTVGANDAGAAIGEIAAEVSRRRDDKGIDKPIFLLIDDLSRFRDLRKSDDDFGFGGLDRDKPPSPGKAFGEILRDGPAVGVHVLAWCDSYNNVDRWLGRQLIREFEMRVAFQMSATDSSNLVDSPAASRLGVNRALLHLDERGTIEKFRPYGPPSADWLDRVRERLRSDTERPEDLDINEWIVT